jgi:hypothetical protein
MPRIALPIAVLMLALAASAGAAVPAEVNPSDSGQAVAAQDFRSPDARTAAVTTSVAALSQDYRSPDARTAAVTTSVPPSAQDLRSPDGGRVAFTSVPVLQDLRSPDGGPSGGFGSSVPASAPAPAVTDGGGSFAWGYLVAAIGVALLGLGAVLITHRRHHHGLAPGH